MFLPQELIRKKRDGMTLTEQELQFFVAGLVDGKFSDAQVGAMAMAIFQNDMNIDERVAFTKAMMNSGTVLTWEGFDAPIVDKHSTGGVGDKVSFMLAAIVAACGAYVPMISGRGLGHTGGTSDKLEAIKGFNVAPTIPEFKRIVKDLGMAIISQTSDLAPADKRLYSIRDVTGTVESIPLITASILSKKLAAGLDTLVMDVKMGNGAIMPTLDQAKALADSITGVANGAGVKTQAFITDMNQVLGHSAGNAVEMAETAEYLSGEYLDPRLHAVVVTLAKAMLVNSGTIADNETASAKIEQVLNDGTAAELFNKMIAELGGPSDFVQNPWGSMTKANVIVDLVAPQSGYINSTNTRNIGLAVVELGGGRTAPGQLIDHSVGYDKLLPVGSKVAKGDIIGRVHASTEDAARKAQQQFIDNLTIGESKPEETPIVYPY
jgi:thymidine phosphorylase